MTFPSTLLPQTNDPKDIQKGILDLLDKINKVAPSTGASGSTYKSVSASYTFTSSDGITDLFVTTGATSVTITLDKSSNGPRTVRIWKSDSGVGEVVVIGNTTGGTTETINGYANVIAGLRYQHCDIYQDGQGNNFLVGQYLQPVSGEPSLGTWKDIAAPTAGDVYLNASPTAGTWYTVTFTVGSAAGNVPVGAKKVKVSVRGQDAIPGSSHWFYRPYGSGAAQINARIFLGLAGNATNVSSGCQAELPIDSAGRVEVSADFNSARLQIAYPFGYCC